ncbi:MAG TPA: Si-specific NAD(P)(+) transhydrogenase [Gemmatimonadaceae bacterium]|jgi:NAD(P) transhydrogenase|nr:Si-specific NAD(P)(+) transhydrogenase [Gemmatimonadaceae bacterium]
MSEHFDLVVIGSGPAGEKGAAQAAYFGKRVCMIERAPKPGGAAVNTGTVPSKTLRETALYFSGLRQRGMYGIDYQVKRDITISDFMYRERLVVEGQWQLIDENIRRHEITQIQGAARFVDPGTVEVTRFRETPRHITGEYFLIATGAHPLQPADLPVDGSVVVDSDSLLALEKIPESMIVLGGGLVGCEYACIFGALGVPVTLITSRSRLLNHLDAEVSEALRERMTARLGISVHVGTEIKTMAVADGSATVILGDDTQLAAKCLLYAEGRVGASSGLGLEAIGVDVNARGFIQVDSHYRTASPKVYAAGDVIGYPAMASVSMEEARVAVCHAFDLRYKQAVANVIPYGLYTIPEVAAVGMSEEQLRAQGIDYEVGRSWYRTNPRGQVIGDVEGFVKLLFSPDNQRLFGACIIGDGAVELIHIAMSCLYYEGTIDFFIQSVFNYPSLADAYKYAAYDGLQSLARRYAKRTGLTPSNGRPAVSL